MISEAARSTSLRDREPFGLAPTLFVFCVAAFAFPWLSGRVTIPWDAKAHFHPQFVFLAHALHNGQSPFWTPNVFAGMPQIADPQSLIFSPFFLLAAALVPEPSFVLGDAISFAMLAMGGLALIGFFRDRGWSAAGALIAALAFALGGSAAWRLQHTGQIMSLAWLPVSLWLLARALDRRSIAYGAAAGAVAAPIFAGGEAKPGVSVPGLPDNPPRKVMPKRLASESATRSSPARRSSSRSNNSSRRRRNFMSAFWTLYRQTLRS